MSTTKQSIVTQFVPIQFKGTDFVPKETDMNIYARSLAQRQARQDQANKDYSDFGKELGKIEEKLHNDPVTKSWFQDYKNRKLAPIQEEIDAGNYGNALNAAVRAASDITRDPEVLGRIKANENFQQERKVQQQRREAGKISQATYDWWNATTPFIYEDLKDADGNIVGGSDSLAEFRPTDDIDIAKQAALAFSLIKSKKGSYDNKYNITTDRFGNIDPKILNKYFTETTDENGNRVIKYVRNTGDVYDKLSRQDILDNMDELIKVTPDGERSIKQLYDVARYECDRLKETYEKELLKDPNSLKTKDAYDAWSNKKRMLETNDGSPIGFKEYYANVITNNLFANKLAYDYHNTKWDLELYDITNDKGGSSPSAPNNEQNQQPTSFTKGPTLNDKSGFVKNGQTNPDSLVNAASRKMKKIMSFDSK